MDRLCLVNSVPFKVPIQIVAQKIRYPSFSKSGVTNIYGSAGKVLSMKAVFRFFKFSSFAP